MRHDFLPASTKYNDLLGTAAADWADPVPENSFKDVFESAGLDFSTYFPVAYSFSMVEEQWGPESSLKDAMFVLVAHCVSKNTVGSTMKEVQDAVGPNGRLPIHRFSLHVDAEEFFRLLKRFEVTFPNSRGNTEVYLSGSITEDIQDETTLT